MGTVTDLNEEDLRQRREALLRRVSMPWSELARLAEAYALDASERNIYETVRAIDYLLDGDADE